MLASAVLHQEKHPEIAVVKEFATVAIQQLDD